MGEVGANTADSPHVELKMNGGINGNCNDEPMDVDAQDDPQLLEDAISKKTSDSAENTNVENDTSVADTDASEAPHEKSNSIQLDETNSSTDENAVNDSTAMHTNGDSDAEKLSENNNESDEKENNNSDNDSQPEELPEPDSSTAANDVIDETDSKKQSAEDDTTEAAAVKDSDDSAEVTESGSTERTVESTSQIDSATSAREETTNKVDKNIPIEDEVHAISDSDDDDDVRESIPKTPIDVSRDDSNSLLTELNTSKSNGVQKIVIDDDKPVSIHSDSDSEMDDADKDEVHEILSDKEDCVVIEDDKKIDGSELAVRSINRNRKSAVRPREYTAYDDDIEEIIEDPLEQNLAKKPRLDDPLGTGSESQQLNQGSNKSKEPTLVIIDTNTILSRGSTAANVQQLNKQNVSVLPVGVPAQQNVFPIDSRASITPVPNSSQIIDAVSSTTLAGLNTPVLTALTDDMFVLEAPSFIVPYIYEKPPAEDLKEIVTKMGTEIEERKKTEEGNEKSDQEQNDAKEDGEKSEGEDEAATAAAAANVATKSKKKKKVKNADDSWDESDMSTDEDASDVEDTKVLIKEAKSLDLDSIKPHIINRDLTKDSNPDEKKDSNNYFDSPLGKFFMDIGINLVQEHVQTDLLRQQKRKLNREGNQASPSVQVAINSLMKNLELSKGKNDVFKFETKRCEYCNFKSESSLVMAHHYETPHMKGNLYKCNFCSYEVKPPYDILFHMKTVHNIQARLEKAASYHQCPNCMFEDNGRSKLARHAIVCGKKFRPEVNLAPPPDWDPPAKIPRIKPRHGLVGTANAYQAMAAQAQRAATAAAIQRQNAANAAAMMKNRGRPQSIPKTMPVVNNNIVRANQQAMRPQVPGAVVLPQNFNMNTPGQYIQVPNTGIALLPNVQNSFNLMQPTGSKTQKSTQQPSISITALPRQSQPGMHSSANASANSMPQSAAMLSKPPGIGNVKPGQNQQQGRKPEIVVCEICDGYIKDLDQLRNHMQWMHKVKIHPKMIYNRPPLNCQKCQFRFFTDQGLERHLLGSHGLVTSSMQEAANKGKDAGRCPVCGRMYQWKLLNHVSREHNMTLKPAHLSYKCTVCTATFGMYKQFENHVYSAHSTVAKKSNDSKKSLSSTSSNSTGNNSRSGLMVPGAGASLLKQPFKINDEITITPQPASRNNRPIEIESHVID